MLLQSLRDQTKITVLLTGNVDYATCRNFRVSDQNVHFSSLNSSKNPRNFYCWYGKIIKLFLTGKIYAVAYLEYIGPRCKGNDLASIRRSIVRR
jgi:hypothetical protein